MGCTVHDTVMQMAPTPYTLPDDLPGRLRAAREAAGWSQGKLAAAAKVRRQAVNRWEAGKQTPSLASLEALCRALGTGWLTQETT